MDQEIEDLFYHGSPNTGLARLDRTCAWTDAVLGPGIYFSRSGSVASRYAEPDGSVYVARFTGDWARTIDLNRTTSEQSGQARDAILRTCRSVADANASVRCILHPATAIEDRATLKAAVADALREQGIWLLHGELGADEESGARDRCRQYIVLDDRFITLVGELTQEEIYDPCGAWRQRLNAQEHEDAHGWSGVCAPDMA